MTHLLPGIAPLPSAQFRFIPTGAVEYPAESKQAQKSGTTRYLGAKVYQTLTALEIYRIWSIINPLRPMTLGYAHPWPSVANTHDKFGLVWSPKSTPSSLGNLLRAKVPNWPRLEIQCH